MKKITLFLFINIYMFTGIKSMEMDVENDTSKITSSTQLNSKIKSSKEKTDTHESSKEHNRKNEKKVKNKQNQDFAQLLEENNKLLRETKRQNRAILKQNYLIFEHGAIIDDINTLGFKLPAYTKKHTLRTKMKEIYIAEKASDASWNSEDEDVLELK